MLSTTSILFTYLIGKFITYKITYKIIKHYKKSHETQSVIYWLLIFLAGINLKLVYLFFYVDPGLLLKYSWRILIYCSVTSACRQGRTSIVILRCDIQLPGNGTIELPSHCPDGTCDGCTYLFLWKSKFACPRCNQNNYTEIVEQCNGGKQKVVRIRPK